MYHSEIPLSILFVRLEGSTHSCFGGNRTFYWVQSKDRDPRRCLKLASLTGTIVEIDDHGNAVTDLEIDPFTERGWKLGDTLEAAVLQQDRRSR